MEQEREKLNSIIAQIKEVIEDSNLKLDNIKELYRFNYDVMLEEKFRLETYIRSLEKAEKTPYFARIDFQNHKQLSQCYIGKRGIMDYDGQMITVDWRAPIASLYYDANVGECTYEAPEGTVKGNLLLKRQYTIEDGKLISYSDVDTVSNDELLKPYLNVSADNRLKNIIATIQSEQNKIIRSDMSKNIVVQGVAGSGKTTVALHRIAYLVYRYKDVYKPSDYMVIGPNQFFVSYISNILPDLDVNGVTQNTLEELFFEKMGNQFTINRYLDVIKEYDENAKQKCSIDMKKRIDQYFENLKVLPNEDLVMDGIEIAKQSLVKELYQEANNGIFKSVQDKIERVMLLLEKYINDNMESYSNLYIKNNHAQSILEKFKANTHNYLKKYFKILNVKAKDIYIEILKESNIDIKNIEKNIIDIEDVAPLLYIQHQLTGNKEWNHYKHIVIDEAQDYGEFTFYVLRAMFQNATFSIYGDLLQGIYPYRSIKNWETLAPVFDDFEILKLNKSYRTTIEIMNEANKIGKMLGFDQAIPVIRHGEEVEKTSAPILEILHQLKQSYKTIAIITKTQESANRIHAKIDSDFQSSLITAHDQNYDSEITVLPSYLSKGLEFDAVILTQPGEYDMNNTLDMKLLYVAQTR